MIEQTPSRRATITGLERGKRSWRRNRIELEKGEAGITARYHNSLHSTLRSSGLSYNVYSLFAAYLPDTDARPKQGLDQGVNP